MARVVRPGGRVVVLEITSPTRPPLSTFFELWFDHVVPVLGRLAGDADAYTYLPSSVRRFPRPARAGASDVGCGLRQIRYLLTAGGIIALHVGEVRAMSTGSAVQAVVDAGGAPVRRGCWTRRAAHGRAGRRPRPAAGPGAGETMSAGGKRLRPLLVCLAAGAPPPETEGLSGPRSPSSWCTSATLVHDDVLDGSPLRRAARRWSPPAAAAWPPRPATCCSRARSPSSPRAGRWRRCGRCRAPAPSWPRVS